MKWAVVIEKERKEIVEVENLFKEVDPNLVVLHFENLLEFKIWLLESIEKKKSGEMPKDDVIQIIIVNQNVFTKRFIGLLSRVREFLIRRELATKESPTAFIITGFEGEKKKANQAAHPVVSDVWFKPFDRVIVGQSIVNALNPEKSFSMKYVFMQKLDSKIDSLKQVDVIRLSEYGFTTLSDRPLKVGEITKFHHPLFLAGNDPGIYARCRICQEDQKEKGMFLCHFSFYSITAAQILSLRQFLKQQHKSMFHPSFPHYSEKTGKKKSAIEKPTVQNIAIVDPDSKLQETWSGLIQRNFANANVIFYRDSIQFIKDIDPLFFDDGKTPPSGLPLPAEFKAQLKPDTEVMKIEDSPIEENFEFLGVQVKDLPNQQKFFTNRVFEDDKPRWDKFLRLKTSGSSEVFRFKHRLGHYSFLRITVAGATADFTQIKMKELTKNEQAEFLKKDRKFTGPLHAIFFGEKAVGEDINGRIATVRKALDQGKVQPQGTSAAIVLLVQSARTILATNPDNPPDVTMFMPIDFDRSLVLQVLAQDIPGLAAADIKQAMKFCVTRESLRAVKVVHAEDISESGVTIKYYRSMPIGEFRSFFLPIKQATELTEFLGRCHACNAIQGSTDFKITFTFFGMTDAYLKYIRTWMKLYYVDTKKEEAA